MIAVLTVRDMDDLAPPPPDDGSGGGGEGGPMPLGGPWSEPLLAVDTVRFVGEPVAVVITDGRYQGEDAADLVSVDYDPLPAVVGPAAAVKDETPAVPRGRDQRRGSPTRYRPTTPRSTPARWSSSRTSSTSGSPACRWRGARPRPPSKTAS